MDRIKDKTEMVMLFALHSIHSIQGILSNFLFFKEWVNFLGQGQLLSNLSISQEKSEPNALRKSTRRATLTHPPEFLKNQKFVIRSGNMVGCSRETRVGQAINYEDQRISRS